VILNAFICRIFFKGLDFLGVERLRAKIERGNFSPAFVYISVVLHVIRSCCRHPVFCIAS
jgi:hypothetical protein